MAIITKQSQKNNRTNLPLVKSCCKKVLIGTVISGCLRNSSADLAKMWKHLRYKWRYLYRKSFFKLRQVFVVESLPSSQMFCPRGVFISQKGKKDNLAGEKSGKVLKLFENVAPRKNESLGIS